MMAMGTLPSRREERLLCDETVHRTVSLHALATGEIGRIDALLKTLDGQLDKVVVKDDGYEVAFKAGVTVEVEI